MQLAVNGKEATYNVKDLSELLKSLNLKAEAVVIEWNGSVLPRGENKLLSSGDELEIVSFVGGG